MRTTPGRLLFPNWMNESPEIYRPPVRGGSNFINVEPNPTTDYKIQKVDPHIRYVGPQEASTSGSQNVGLAANTLRGAYRIKNRGIG